ncbi:MAG: tRNA preQ1(34) S-adenosylmethionine ribosyltransferase-isomerase QueA, partial [Planctomycetota bacterium]
VDTGGRWQGLFLREDDEQHWRIVCKTRGRLKPGVAVRLLDRDARPVDKLWLLERLESGQWLAHLDSETPASDALPRFGRVPLPPYIRDGRMTDDDITSYQTVFAKRPGAVAAPTAGLHFTPTLLAELERQQVGLTAVTLHVGLGTFRPIAEGAIDQHDMHSEWCEVSEKAASQIEATRASGGRVIAVGTTAVRTLETAAEGGEGVQPLRRETDLFIKPGHTFRAIDAMITNFHFPETTLLLLVQAFGGSGLIRRAYHEAIEQRYRFYSYGDAMLIV